VAVTNGGIRVTSNGGTTWTAQTSGLTSLSGIVCPGTSNCFAVGPANTIAATTNGGTAWASQSSGTTQTLNDVDCGDLNHCWALGNNGVIVAYKVTCTGGTLGIAAPSSITFPGVTLHGLDQSVTTTGTFTPDDETGSGSGWKLSAYATAWSDGHGNTLPAPTVTAASTSLATGPCVVPTPTVSYPTSALGATAGTATKIYNAAAGTGTGPANVTLTFSQSVPANQKIGTTTPDSFTSTWTFTIASGP